MADRFYKEEPRPIVEAPSVLAALDQVLAAQHEVMDLLGDLASRLDSPVVDVTVEAPDDPESAREETQRDILAALLTGLQPAPERVTVQGEVRITEPVALDNATLEALKEAVKAVRANAQAGQRIIAAGGSGASKLPDLTGTWGYNAGVSGTLNLANSGKRILTITATSAAGGTMTINGGDSIVVPASGSITVEPHVQLTEPTIVFTGTTGYFVDWLTG